MENIYTNHQLFRTLAENSNVAIFLFRDKRLIYANPAFERILGYSFTELCNGEILNMVHPEQRAIIADRIAKRFAGETVPDKYEIRLISKSGEERWMDLSITLTDYHDMPTAIATGVDITERKKAEVQLKHSESELQSILDNLQDTYYRTDLDGRIVRASKSVNNLLGYRDEELLGTNLADLYVNIRGREQFLQILRQNKGVVKNHEAELRRKDGSTVWVSTNAHYYFDTNGNIKGVEGNTRDITDIYRTREQLQNQHNRLEELVAERTFDLGAANRELESFCYSVSHDLRAPLRTIDGFSQILMEDYAPKLDQTSCDYLNRIRSGAQRMGQLIDDLLKLSRISSGELNKKTTNLSNIAHETAEGLRHTNPQRNAEIIIESDVYCRGDAGLLRVVLENLFSNAWKYTQYLQSQTRIEFGRQQHNGNTVYYIKDNGVGFDMNYANRLFCAFQRLHSAAEFEGSGIGLATVQRIIQRHGGKIWAEGQQDKGAGFYFSLPESGVGK